MIKRIIFDVDDTLLVWKEEYWNSLNQSLDIINYSYDRDLIIKMRNSIHDYETQCIIYNKEEMLKAINNNLDKKLPATFMDIWLKELASCVENVSDELIDSLEYLSHKYELVILSNWFDSQTMRLSKVGLLKYFKKVYMADNVPRKPYKESFMAAADGISLDECIMIGDSIHFDIEVPLQIGMKAIYYNINNEKTNLQVPSFKHFNELKKLL